MRTQHGFVHQDAEVICLSSDRNGTWIQVRGKREAVDVRVTPGGRVRFWKARPTPTDHFPNTNNKGRKTQGSES